MRREANVTFKQTLVNSYLSGFRSDNMGHFPVAFSHISSAPDGGQNVLKLPLCSYAKIAAYLHNNIST